MDENYDPKRDIVLGPWCFEGREEDFPDWEDLEFVDPFTSEAEIVECAQNVRKLNAYLISQLIPQMNERHGTSYGRAFWYTILTPWLLELIQAVVTRYKLIERAVERYGATDLNVSVWTEDHDWDFEDVWDFNERGLYHPLFDWWLRSKVLAGLAPANWELVSRVPNDNTLVKTYEQSPVPEEPPFHRRVIRYFRELLAFTNLPGARWTALPLVLFANMLPKKTVPVLDPVADAGGDDFRPQDHFPGGMLTLLDNLIDIAMPRCLRQDFTVLLAAAKKKPYFRGRLRFGVFDYQNFFQRLQTALAIDTGEWFVQAQHGGYYNLTYAYPTTGENEYFGHHFLSWGWRRHPEYPEISSIPTSSPLLSKLADRHRYEDEHLILVTTVFWVGHQRVWSGPSPSQVVTSRRQKVDFLRSLDQRIRDHTSYRPHPQRFNDLQSAEYVQKHVADIPVLGGSLHEPLLKCRLQVLDHPGTTLNIAYAANIPTICIWEEDVWSISSIGKPHFEAMKNHNMYFTDPASAAKFINENWKNIEKWWSGEDVQNVRKKFCDEFAQTNPFWMWEWIKTLYRISRA